MNNTRATRCPHSVNELCIVWHNDIIRLTYFHAATAATPLASTVSNAFPPNPPPIK